MKSAAYGHQVKDVCALKEKTVGGTKLSKILKRDQRL
jgi:hypothetical protein